VGLTFANKLPSTEFPLLICVEKIFARWGERKFIEIRLTLTKFPYFLARCEIEYPNTIDYLHDELPTTRRKQKITGHVFAVKLSVDKTSSDINDGIANGYLFPTTLRQPRTT